MRNILLVIGLLSATHEVAAQNWATRPDERALPDSTFLALTLELPAAGTFYVTRHTMRRVSSIRHDNVQVRDFFYLDRVDLAGCRMTYYHRTGGARVDATKIDIPLKQIDLESIALRQLAGATADIPPWEIHVKAADRSERPFAFSRRGYAAVRSSNNFSIPIVDRDRAIRFADLLKDAATRCETWNTSPIQPVR